MWSQREIRLRARPRGFHLVTREVAEAMPELGGLRVGLAHLHLLHTSASLTLNENASPTCAATSRAGSTAPCPRTRRYWTHTDEGPDDMPAHIKASLLGASLTLPVRDGRFALGTWQGVYLCEHRDNGGAAVAARDALGRGLAEERQRRLALAAQLARGRPRPSRSRAPPPAPVPAA